MLGIFGEPGDGSFEDSTGLAPFIQFEERLQVIRIVADRYGTFHEVVVREAEEARNEYIKLVEQQAADYISEAIEFGESDVATVAGMLPFISFGSLSALTLTSLEHLLKELCDHFGVIENKPLQRLPKGSGEAKAEYYLRFLREEIHLPLELNSETLSRWTALRKTRNALMHALDGSYWEPATVFDKDTSGLSLVGESIEVVSEVAQTVADGCLSTNRQDAGYRWIISQGPPPDDPDEHLAWITSLGSPPQMNR